jgi:membrane protease YdiL (CAAX protease family)
MKRLLLLELLIVLAAGKILAWLSDVPAFAAIVPPMPVLGYAYLQFVVVLALIAWLKFRKARLSDYGLRDFGSFGLFAFITIAAIATSVILPTTLGSLLAQYFGAAPRDLSRFATLVGNLPQFLWVMPLVWVFAAFGEEFLYRGFILENLHRALGGGNAAMIAAIIFQAALFGAGHAYQGPVGMIPIAVGGIVSGFLYWAGGRRLWSLILAHGIVDTIGFTIMFRGGTP